MNPTPTHLQLSFALRVVIFESNWPLATAEYAQLAIFFVAI
jgi:hypothetical protein